MSARLSVCRNARWREHDRVSDVLAEDRGMEEHQGTSPEWPNMTTHRSWGEKEVCETYTALEGGSNIWRVLCGRVVLRCIFS